MNTPRNFIVVALLTACSSPQGNTVTTVTDNESAPPPAAVSPLTEAMRDHWAVAAWTRDAIIAGDLAAAGKGARLLAEDEPNPAVPDWTPFVSQMREEAERVALSASLGDAAAAIGELGATCGACHVETGAVLRFEDAAPPQTSVDVEPHMARHAWASKSMWRGLVGPSDDAWVAGADALGDRPLHDNEYFARWEVTDDVAALGVRVHDLGVAARSAAPEDRGRLFGELVSTCASCHASLMPR